MIGLAFDGEFEHPHPLPCQWMIDGDATGQGLRETSTFTKDKARDMMSTSHMFCHPTFRKKDLASFRRRTLPRWGGFLREAGSDGTQVTVPDTLRLRQQDCAKNEVDGDWIAVDLPNPTYFEAAGWNWISGSASALVKSFANAANLRHSPQVEHKLPGMGYTRSLPYKRWLPEVRLPSPTRRASMGRKHKYLSSQSG